MVVSYRPGPEFLDHLKVLARQVDQIVVVDNSSSPQFERQLSGLEIERGWKVICNRQNLGIAAALNLGVEYALQRGFAWIATFDQDSQIEPGYFSKMFDAYTEFGHPEKVALISPVYVDRNTGLKIRVKRRRNGKILTNMTSGSLIPAGAFQKLGPFDENLFIDAVDKEFCLRAHKGGMSIVDSGALLLHSLGKSTYHSIFCLRFVATNHTAARRYYIVRNGVRLLFRYRYDPAWVLYESKNLLADAVQVAMVEHEKVKKFRAMASGLMDALRGRMGKQVEL